MESVIGDLATAIPLSVFQLLQRSHGGGPEIKSLGQCHQCRVSATFVAHVFCSCAPIAFSSQNCSIFFFGFVVQHAAELLQARRDEETAAITRLDVGNEQGIWYIISAVWLKQWLDFKSSSDPSMQRSLSLSLSLSLCFSMNMIVALE